MTGTRQSVRKSTRLLSLKDQLASKNSPESQDAMKPSEISKNPKEFVIKKTPFQRSVREIAQNYGFNLRFQPAAFLALQEASETYIVDLLHDINRSAVHAKRKTITQEDIEFTKSFQQ